MRWVNRRVSGQPAPRQGRPRGVPLHQAIREVPRLCTECHLPGAPPHRVPCPGTLDSRRCGNDGEGGVVRRVRHGRGEGHPQGAPLHQARAARLRAKAWASAGTTGEGHPQGVPLHQARAARLRAKARAFAGTTGEGHPQGVPLHQASTTSVATCPCALRARVTSRSRWIPAFAGMTGYGSPLPTGRAWAGRRVPPCPACGG